MDLYLTSEQSNALQSFRLDRGRCWKAALRKAWRDGDYEAVPVTDGQLLQQLRNSAHFGPSGLIAWPEVEVIGG